MPSFQNELQSEHFLQVQAYIVTAYVIIIHDVIGVLPFTGGTDVQGFTCVLYE